MPCILSNPGVSATVSAPSKVGGEAAEREANEHEPICGQSERRGDVGGHSPIGQCEQIPNALLRIWEDLTPPMLRVELLREREPHLVCGPLHLRCVQTPQMWRIIT